MSINSICVCGAGTMGRGIAQSAAQAGIHTILFDLNNDVLESSRKFISKDLDKLAGKGKISEEEKNKIFQRIRFTDDLQECLADVIIEAIVEKIEIKTGLFNQLAEINHGEVIFASNTSSLSVSDIAHKVLHPGRVIGMHFFNPATIMKLVEVVTTPHTYESTIDTVINLARQMGKTPVVCQDAPGFIVNRVARPFYIEALRIAEENAAGFEQIDRVLEGTGFKMGPFKLMDLIGNDVNYSVSCSVFEQLGSPARLQPSPIQKQLVEEGRLGKKSGAGYYNY